MTGKAIDCCISALDAIILYCQEIVPEDSTCS